MGVKTTGKKHTGRIVLCAGIAVLACICAGVLLAGTAGGEGEARVTYRLEVSEEEYAFFRSLAEKELPSDAPQEQLDAETQELLYRTVAEFSIGERLGLCSAYSFSGLELQMEQENRLRQAKKENGEVVYGLLEYNLSNYYSDSINKLRLAIADELEEQADRELMKRVEAYFEENASDYDRILSFTYSLTENGQTTTETIQWEDMRLLERQDEELFAMLLNGEAGDTLSYTYLETPREVELLAVEKSEADFETAKSEVMEDYIEEVYYEELVQREMEQYELRFPDSTVLHS